MDSHGSKNSPDRFANRFRDSFGIREIRGSISIFGLSHRKRDGKSLLPIRAIKLGTWIRPNDFDTSKLWALTRDLSPIEQNFRIFQNLQN